MYHKADCILNSFHQCFREALLDPYLSRYAVIIIDEAHERTVHTDVLLGLLKRVQKTRSQYASKQSNVDLMKANFNTLIKREENGPGVGNLQQCQRRNSNPLKLIIMSASLDARGFSEFFDNAKAVHVQGRQFPVDIYYTFQPQTDCVDAALLTIFQVFILYLLRYSYSDILLVPGSCSIKKSFG